MRVLFDIVHPADVHFFKHAVFQLVADGHEVLLTSRVKDIVVRLLSELNLPNRVVSEQGAGPIGLFAELVRRDIEILKLARRFRPHVLVGNNSPTVAHVGFLLRRPSVVFDDTEINRYVRLLYQNFVTEIHSPRCYRLDLGSRHVRYPGHHALAYLHPQHFRMDPTVIESCGLAVDEPYFVFRFVSWGASHDLGVTGLTTDKKEELVDLASRFGRVVISAEGELPVSLRRYRVRIRAVDMHHVLAGAAGLVGESATMCSEAACLGLPSVLVDHYGRGYTDELEKTYRLTVRHPPEHWKSLLSAVKSLFEQRRAAGEVAEQHMRLIENCVNVSRYQLTQIARLGQMG